MDTTREDAFPLPWEQILWCGAPAFPWYLSDPGTRYVLTEFRLVLQRHSRTIREAALDRIASVRLTQSRWQRAVGTSSVRVELAGGEPPLVVAHLLHGPQLTLLLQLRAAELSGEESWNLNAEFFRAALAPEAPPLLRGRRTRVLVAMLGLASMLGAGQLVGRSSSMPPAPGLDEAGRAWHLTGTRTAAGCHRPRPVE